ncbi:MAG: biotin/lipoyl-binding protein [Rhizobiales bacterium]|nr:biotin/lipoyl-binding protein [Hyphomicrobiales bacterium]
MQYRSREIRIMNQLNDDSEISGHFRVPPDLRIMSIIIIIVFITTIAAAIFMKVDQIVPALGVLETQQKLFEVRSTVSGLIRRIHVKEGDKVSKGDILINIDSEQIELKIASLEKQQDAITRTIWTNYYEIEGQINQELEAKLKKSVHHIDDPIGKIGYQKFLRNKLSNEIVVMEKSVAELKENQKRDVEQLKLSEQNNKLVKGILIRQTKLFKQNVGTKAEYEKAQQKFLSTQERVASLKSNIKTYLVKHDRLIAEQEKMKNSFISDRLIKIYNNFDQYARISFEQKGLNRKLEELTLRAPFDAIVDSLYVLGKHEVVKSGAKLVSLRSIYDPKSLTIDMVVPSNFAIWVQEGMTFRASSRGNSPDDHGYITGKIGYISKSTKEEKGVRLYRIKGIIENFDFSEDFKLESTSHQTGTSEYFTWEYNGQKIIWVAEMQKVSIIINPNGNIMGSVSVDILEN